MTDVTSFTKDSWKKLQVIGKGGSSTVFKGVLISNGKYVAVKEISIEGYTSDQILGIRGEVTTIQSLYHKNIIRFLGTEQTETKIYIFLEYADCGSLRHFYQKQGALSEIQTSNCLRHILEGLQYLHSLGIAHRDVKGANVLLCSDGSMKLADFGASKRVEMDSLVSGLKGYIFNIYKHNCLYKYIY